MSHDHPVMNGESQIPAVDHDYIESLHDKHRGEEVVLLGNGRSLGRHPWGRLPIGVRTFGVNQSWRAVPRASYHFVVDTPQYDSMALGNVDYYDWMASKGRLLTTKGWKLGKPIEHGMGAPIRFSRDLHVGVRISTPLPAPVQVPRGDGTLETRTATGSVLYAALQIAVWMGFERFWIAGMDMDGVKLTGAPSPYSVLHDALWRMVPMEIQERTRVIAPSATKVLQVVEWPW